MTAHLIGRGVDVGNHEDRERELVRPSNAVPLPVFRAYRRLKGRGIGARYLLQEFTPAQVRALLDGPLVTVTRFVSL